MRRYEVRVHQSAERFPRHDELAWHLAELASDPVGVDDEIAEMVVNRLVDDVAAAVGALSHHAVASARAVALSRPDASGATVIGLGADRRFEVEWAAFANGVAVRELDFHDTFLAAEYAHPGDNIPPLLATAQRLGRDGAALVRAIAIAYEVQVDLAKAISLHDHGIDHVAHLGPSVAAGIGCLLDLDVEAVYQAIGQALHTTTATRQSRKGTISSWKAYAPAFAAKAAIEAVDRAMRGETSPSPIYEGEDGVIARLLDGPGARYVVELPEAGEPRRAILETYTKAHSAEYQAQALIDLAVRMRPRIPDPGQVRTVEIRTSDHTHHVIGSGSNDPEKYDPSATRETLDHSVPYVFAVALEDGFWHHETSYAPARARRRETVALWRKVRTVEDPSWTRRYHADDPSARAFGGHVVVEMDDGTVIEDELAVADAHPNGERPFGRAGYVDKFRSLAEGVVESGEQDRFLDLATRLASASPKEVAALTVAASSLTTPVGKAIL